MLRAKALSLGLGTYAVRQMSPRARVFRGVGREVNPLDGDQVVIKLGVRDGKIAHIGASALRPYRVSSGAQRPD